MKKYFVFMMATGLLTLTGLSSLAHAAKPVIDVGTIAGIEATRLASVGYMANAIEYHRCLTRDQVIQDINHTFYYKESSIVARFGYKASLEETDEVLSGYTRDQIVAAEVVELSQMEPAWMMAPNLLWIHDVQVARQNGDTFAYGALLAESPHMVVATLFHLVTELPMSAAEDLMNAANRKHCTPIEESN
jgi:hypothetical protein